MYSILLLCRHSPHVYACISCEEPYIFAVLAWAYENVFYVNLMDACGDQTLDCGQTEFPLYPTHLTRLTQLLDSIADS